jgi:hypothetical protein
MTVAIVAGVLIGTVNFSTIAFAAKPADPNCFGDAASDEGGDLGTHSRDGGAAGDHPYDEDEKPGRSGIGNIGEDAGLTDSKHPSDLANELGADCD